MPRFVFEEDGAGAAPAAPPAPRFVFEDVPAPAPSLGASAARGAVQGATLGFSDEIAGKTAELGSRLAAQAKAGSPLLLPGPRKLAALYPGVPYMDAMARWKADTGYGSPERAAAAEAAYLDPANAARGREVRDAERAANAEAQAAHPAAYLASSVAGSSPLALATGGAAGPGAGLGARMLAGARAAAPAGAAYGAGMSEADTLGGRAVDALEGGIGAALLGGAAPAVGAGVRRVLSPIARKGADLVARGTARANQQAAEESAAAVRSLESATGERAANAYRQMERIELALANPATPAAERAALEAFKQSPEYAALVATNAKSILAAAPGAAAEREAAAAVAQEARQNLPQAIQSRAAELLTPQARADTLSFLKSYAEPAVWALGAQQAANALGLSPAAQSVLAIAAGTVGGRTRAGKALVNRLTRPAHQVAIGNALRRIGTPPSVPPSATQAAAVGLDPELDALLSVLRGRPGFVPAAAEEGDR